MKVSLIQMNSISDKAANIAAAEALIERAVPEERPTGCCCRNSSTGPAARGPRSSRTPRSFPAARPMRWRGPGEEAPHLRPRRLDHGEIDGEARYHNTSVVFNRDGEEIARYRKIHLFDVTTPGGTAYRRARR